MNVGSDSRTDNSVVIGTPVLLTGGTEVQSLFLVRVLMGLGKRMVVCRYHEQDVSMVTRHRQPGAEVMLLSLPRSRTLAAILSLTVLLTFSRLRTPHQLSGCECSVPGDYSSGEQEILPGTFQYRVSAI